MFDKDAKYIMKVLGSVFIIMAIVCFVVFSIKVGFVTYTYNHSIAPKHSLPHVSFWDVAAMLTVVPA